jgi:hypothetical protein
MDLAMGVAIGSSIQIALLVTPFLVIVGWIIGSEMTLHFETCKFHNSHICKYIRSQSHSPNCCICRLCPCCDLYGPGWQVQLSRGCYAYGSLHYHCPGFLRHPI